jgi:hypothetical protein
MQVYLELNAKGDLVAGRQCDITSKIECVALRYEARTFALVKQGLLY